MPRKVFQPAEVLQAAEVNTFLMDQAVMVFDDATARDAAIPSPIQGMVTFLKDLNVLEAWFGDRWGQVSGAGSITVSETAPTGPEVEDGALWFNSVLGRTFIYYEDDDSAQWVEIGAGSGPTAAAVFTSAPTSAEQGQLWFDAETGNMYFYYVDNDSAQWIQVRSAAPVGGTLEGLSDTDIVTPATGDLLQYDGSDWANVDVNAALGAGKILQVVRATDNTRRDTTSSAFVDANISVTITPTSATSVILIFWTFFGIPASNSYLNSRITDAANTSISGAEFAQFGGSGGVANSYNLIGRDAPGTTSAVTYKGRFASQSGTASIRNDLQTGQMIAMEVSA